jgi:hypothetical protein
VRHASLNDGVVSVVGMWVEFVGYELSHKYE